MRAPFGTGEARGGASATLTCGFVAMAMLLGGASRGAPLAWLVVELGAILLLAALALTGGPRRAGGRFTAATLLALAAALLPAAYLLVLPPTLWTALPGRAEIAAGFTALGAPLPWLPLTLAPWPGLASTLALLPGLAAFFAATRLAQTRPGRLVATIVAVAGFSAALGIVQLAAGPLAGLNPYSGGQWHAADGIFANANHNATLLLGALVLLSALAAHLRDARRLESTTRIGRLVVLGGLALLLIGAAVLTGTIAGLLLLLPAIAGAALVYRNERTGPWPMLLGAGGALVAALGVVVALASPTVADFARTGSTVADVDRLAFFRTTLVAAWHYFPVGSGPGSFETVYPFFENPARVTNVFANHAHNDYLELTLELGLPGIALLAAFLLWWGRRVAAIWTRGASRAPIARAASIVTALILIHSLVDYPLRTATVMVVFAACCALMAVPLATARVDPPARRGRRRLSERARHASA